MSAKVNLTDSLRKIDYEIQRGKFKEAKILVNQLAAFFPYDFDVNCMQAGIEATCGNYNNAIECYNYALCNTDVNQALIDVHYNLAKCYELTSKNSNAILSYISVLNIQPTQPQAWFGLAQNQMILGERVESERAYLEVINFTNISEYSLLRSKAYYALSQSKAKLKNILSMISSDIERCNNSYALAYLYFASANLNERYGFFDKAFKYFTTANKLVLNRIDRYDHGITLAHADGLIASYSEEAINRISSLNISAKIDSVSPIFIIGLPRTGSTLVESLIASSPDTSELGEVDYITQVIAKIAELVPTPAYPNSLEYLTIEKLNTLASCYLALTAKEEGSRTIDKFLANFWNVGLIKSIFPNAKIIACEKNPMDSCLSLYRQYFHEGHPYSYSLEDCADYYLVYQKLMNHWKALFGEDVYRISSESLVTNTEAECQNLFDYCNLQWSSQYLKDFVKRKSVKTASALQVREPINSNGLFRWKNYQSQLAELSKKFE